MQSPGGLGSLGGGAQEETYVEYLERAYGAGAAREEEDDDSCSYATTSVATHERAPPARQPSRPLTAAERLSRNRAAKRAVTDPTGQLAHLSTLYHMHRRIYTSYNKAGLLGADGGPAGGSASRPQSGCSSGPRSAPRPGIAPSPSWCPPQHPRGAAAAPPALARGHTMPPRGAGLAAAAAAAIPAHRPVAAAAAPEVAGPAATAPAPPSYVKRHVQNSRAALKAAMLDEIVEHRVYDGARLRALLRSYLKLNSGEAFYPTLVEVVEELRAELGVA